MADNQAIPLWAIILGQALTFTGGLLSGQFTELLRTRREREARRETRQQSNLERRIGVQRETLYELQETGTDSIERLLFQLNNRNLSFADPELIKKVAEYNDAQSRAVWRWGLLTSRVQDDNVSRAAIAFGKMLFDYRLTFGEADIESVAERLFGGINDLNKAISHVLRSLDDQEIAADRPKE